MDSGFSILRVSNPALHNLHHNKWNGSQMQTQRSSWSEGLSFSLWCIVHGEGTEQTPAAAAAAAFTCSSVQSPGDKKS